MPCAASRIGTFSNCSALQDDGDDAGFAEALPRQAEHEGIELRAGQRQLSQPASRGQTNLPAFNRRAASHTPMPSCTSTFMRLARRLANR